MAKHFLSGPGPEVAYHRVDFGYVNLPEYLGLYAVVLDNVLSPEECQQLIQLAEAQTGGTWEQALVNVGNNEQMLIPDVRDCGRIIWDDREIVEKIWRRVERFVPEIKRQENVPDVTGNGPARRKEVWEMTRLNERMRFLKYGPKQYFRPHCDGTYEAPDKSERSLYTLHLYLNEDDTMQGGETAFLSLNLKRSYKVTPKVGRVLLFQHRSLLHSGEEVENGLKYTLRTDLMYKKADQAA